MAKGKYFRVDGRKSSSYGLTITITAFLAFCLVGAWMFMSSSSFQLQVQNPDLSSQETANEVKHTVAAAETTKFEDSLGDLAIEITKEGSDRVSGKDSDRNIKNDEKEEVVSEKNDEKTELENSVEKNPDENPGEKNESQEETKEGGHRDIDDEGEKNSEKTDGTKKKEKPQLEESLGENESENDSKTVEKSDENASENEENNSKVVFPAGDQAEITKESSTGSGSWSSQMVESQNEKAFQQSSISKERNSFVWKVCNVTAGPDYIPCLDNWLAIKRLRSRAHYEHRERHCPEEAPSCLVPLPKGYKRPVKWPKSREKIWYNNVPHTKLAEVKGHQNWVKVAGEYLTFPGGGTQFIHGALHYIDFIQQSNPDIAWGNRTRVILDVGCGVASFGGYLFERDVLAMSFAPKDEHEAQVQFALERGIPAMLNVMGSRRLPFPGSVFDLIHCARCRVPWHVEGGKLLLELNRVLRPGGFFVWSATPVYRKTPEDVGIWKAMSELTKAMCWKLVTISKDKLNGVAAAMYQKPTSNKCYNKRPQSEPPLCQESDDPNAAWNIPLQACMHKMPEDALKRGVVWPKQWPERLEAVPQWLNSQVGVYGKAASEDFAADDKHWKNVVSKSYLNGVGIDWSSVRNVMDMRAVYGGFSAALKDLKVWVMNVVPIDSPDTLPIIYERGLFGMYHDWCESFNTYPRTYDILHADHLFSTLKNRCNLVLVIAEVDRILRPEGMVIVRDNVETIGEIERLVKSMKWNIRMTYSEDREGLLSVQKSFWRPTESETIQSAIA